MKHMLTPREIVAELDHYVIGQPEAKRSVAIALYNRHRRQQLPLALQHDVTPKNLLMIGPTGVGKTEIARRLAHIVQAPFAKVEATKFTEVGYVGRDVEAMVRDLAQDAVHLEEQVSFAGVRDEATRKANDKIVALLAPDPTKKVEENMLVRMQKAMTKNSSEDFLKAFEPGTQEDNSTKNPEILQKREQISNKLHQGLLENEEVTIQVTPVATEGADEIPGMNPSMGKMLERLSGGNAPVNRTVSVHEARELLIRDISRELVDEEAIHERAIKRAENEGIIFIDEIDKLSSPHQTNSGQVSREGVQRDILPIVEGSRVNTKYGPLDTSHVLFIGSGAFALTKPSDLIPELQGRFPLRVELHDLTKEDFIRILTETKTALVKQYIALVETDGVKLIFTKEAIEKMAEIADRVNRNSDNIGARRLATILEKVLEDILFDSPDVQMGEIQVTEQYVIDKVGSIAENDELSRFIL